MSFLKPKDQIEIVSPGALPDLEKLKEGIKYLKSLDLDVKFDESQLDYSKNRHDYFANSDECRFFYLKKALLNNHNKAIWFSRGGYGCARLLPSLVKMKKPKHKILLGYSDITCLSLFVANYWNWPSIHGPLVESLASDKLSKASILHLQKFLFDKKYKSSFQLRALNQKKIGKVECSLIGGNLTVLASQCGTNNQMNSQNKMVVLEDINERGYRIDRALVQLSQSGSFQKCRAIIFGDFSLGDEPNNKNFVMSTIQSFSSQSKIACFSGLKMGHGKENWALCFGKKYRLNGNSKIVLESLE